MTAMRRNTKPKGAAKPARLAGGNPQIAKAEGDAPVQTYLAAMPGWKRTVGRRLDALIVRVVPGVRKAVKWNSPFYGIEGRGWFLGFHAFTRYLKVTFFRGTSLRPVPPGGTGKDARWLDIHEDDLDEATMARWVKQAAALPGWMTSDIRRSRASRKNPGTSPARMIDERIRELGDWRGKLLSRLRSLIREADPEVTEEWKWNVPVWSHDGLLCTGEAYKQVVKMTFARGAALDDPSRLFNSSLDGNTRRAIDFREGEKINEKALKALIRSAVALNTARAKM